MNITKTPDSTSLPVPSQVLTGQNLEDFTQALPEELILHTLSFLNTKQDLTRCERLNKRFCKILREKGHCLWQIIAKSLVPGFQPSSKDSTKSIQQQIREFLKIHALFQKRTMPCQNGISIIDLTEKNISQWESWKSLQTPIAGATYSIVEDSADSGYCFHAFFPNRECRRWTLKGDSQMTLEPLEEIISRKASFIYQAIYPFQFGGFMVDLTRKQVASVKNRSPNTITINHLPIAFPNVQGNAMRNGVQMVIKDDQIPDSFLISLNPQSNCPVTWKTHLKEANVPVLTRHFP